MPRGHESTWPYPGRYTPSPPPSLKRGPRRPRGREQPPPPPFKERPPSGALAQPPRASRGSPSSPPGPSTPPPSPAAAHGPARSPPRRSTTTRDPCPGALVPSPARPPGIHPAGPVPVRFGREGTAWHFPPPPPGFAPVDDARRDSSPPSGVRAPPLTVAPSAAGAPGSLADFGQPRPPLLPGQPNGDARGWAHRYPTPSRARLPTGPQPPPPSPHAHHAPPPLRTPPSFFTGSRRHRGGLPQPPTGGHLAEKGTPQTRWGSRPCPSFPLLHASWRGVRHTPLPMHHVSWPRVAFASPSSR